MAKIKVRGVQIRKEASGMEIIETKTFSNNAPCKQCKKEERRNGSSRCNTCTIAHKEFTNSSNRLSRKIEEQAKKIV